MTKMHVGFSGSSLVSMSGKAIENITSSIESPANIEYVLLFKTALDGNFIALPLQLSASLNFIKYISSSKITQVSYLYGLSDIYSKVNTTSLSDSDSDDSSGSGHGSSLHGLVSISNPSHGNPPFLGGTHYLYIVYIPPPHANEQSFQSLRTLQYPSIDPSSLGDGPSE